MCSKDSKELGCKFFENAETSSKDLKKELDICERLHDSLTNEVCSHMERMECLDEIDKLSFQKKLLKIQTKCEEFGENLVRLKEDHKLACEREERISSQYAKLREDHHRMVIDKNTSISELKVNLNEVRDRIKKKNEIITLCNMKIWQSDTKLWEMEKELQILKRQKLAAEETIYELREKQLESHQTIEELRQKNLECNITIEELRRSNLEALQTVEDLKRHQPQANEEVTKIQNLASRIKRVEEEVSGLLGSKLDILTNIIEKSGATVENENVTLPCSRGEKQSDGCGNTLNTDSADVGNLAITSPGVQSTFNFSDIEGKNSPMTDIIDIDDETNHGGAACVAKVCSKRKRSIDECDNYGTPIHQDMGKEPEKSTGLEDSDDESCSDSCINAILDSCISRKLSKTWMFGTDLQKAFQGDDNLCLNAVCTLYRQQHSSLESTEDFYHFKAMRGCDLAKYLIDGDPSLKLRKSALEVKQKCPGVIDQCRKLAIDYYEKLFSIYYTRKDPFFN